MSEIAAGVTGLSRPLRSLKYGFGLACVIDLNCRDGHGNVSHAVSRLRGAVLIDKGVIPFP